MFGIGSKAGYAVEPYRKWQGDECSAAESRLCFSYGAFVT